MRSLKGLIGLLILASALQSTTAKAEPKATPRVRKPSVCRSYEFAQGKHGRLAICLDGADKGRRPRVFTEFSEVQMSDGSNWLVGR
jgi:hypothetical protein